MRETEELSVHSCLDLLPGDEITAAHMGTVVHRGRVSDIATNHGIFWILDDLSGGRRLLDLSEVQVMRTKGRAPEIPLSSENE